MIVISSPYVFKKCKECGEILHLFKFKKRKGCKYGRGNKCKKCENKDNAKYRKPKSKEERKEYYEKTKERYKEKKNAYNREYYKTYKRKSEPILYEHICECCGEKFVSRRKDTRFCSQKCVGKSIRRNKKEIDYSDKQPKDRNGALYNEWRKQVYERDNYTCQCCGKHGGKLNVHHLYNYAEYICLRLVIENGVTLCEDCHKKFHRLYGRKHNTKKQYDEFINKN